MRDWSIAVGRLTQSWVGVAGFSFRAKARFLLQFIHGAEAPCSAGGRATAKEDADSPSGMTTEGH